MRRDLRSHRVRPVPLFALFLSLTAFAPLAAAPLGSAFTWQGELQFQGTPAAGSFDLEFRLFDAETGGVQVGTTVSLPGHPVQGGVISATLDFGADAFAGEARWLEIRVGGVTLSPRQAVLAAPAALHAATAGEVGDGGLPATYTDAVTFSSGANAFSGSFSGDGSGLASLSASNIAGGTLNTAVLPSGGTWTLTSDLRVDGATLVVDPVDDRVGVGTSFPQVPLHVVGGADASVAGGGTLVLGSTALQNLVLDGNEMMARDNGAVAQLLLNHEGGDVAIGALEDDARLGVGVSSPTANLHVRGPAALGSVLVTPGAAQGDSQLFLAEQTSTSFGMILRYDGGANQFHMIAQQSGVETPPLLSVNRSSAGNVGIGTIAPQAKLHVAGSARFDGDIAIAPTERYLQLSAASLAYDLEFDDLEIGFRGSDGQPILENQNTLGASRTAGTTVLLPQDATVTEVSVWLGDLAPSQNLEVRMWRDEFGASSVDPELMAQFTSSGATGNQVASDSTIDFATIDNSTYVYWMTLKFPVGTPARSMLIYGIRIAYSVESPLP